MSRLIQKSCFEKAQDEFAKKFSYLLAGYTVVTVRNILLETCEYGPYSALVLPQ